MSLSQRILFAEECLLPFLNSDIFFSVFRLRFHSHAYRTTIHGSRSSVSPHPPINSFGQCFYYLRCIMCTDVCGTPQKYQRNLMAYLNCYIHKRDTWYLLVLFQQFAARKSDLRKRRNTVVEALYRVKHWHHRR